jgi:hypothetical protein
MQPCIVAWNQAQLDESRFTAPAIVEAYEIVAEA